MLQETKLGSLLTDKSWQEQLKGEFEKKYFKDLSDFVFKEYEEQEVFPCKNNIFRAFNLCSFDKVKVVILGQDPYYKPKQANGLSFSVDPDPDSTVDSNDFPPALKNIFHVLKCDERKEIPQNGDLTNWADQGVLLLNAILTVRKDTALSHKNQGWENFTDAVIKLLSQKGGIVFLLWGEKAKEKAKIIDNKCNKVLTWQHPSYRDGLCGSKHFSQTNEYLEENGIEPIEW